MTLKFALAFVGVDLDDFELLDRLAQSSPDVHWGEVDGEVRADVFADRTSFVEAVQEVIAGVRAEAADARAVRIIEDFVAVPDIAKRSHVNRETARLWSREGSFPQPRGVVGNGIKIWDWAAVNTWLRREHSGALGDPFQYPSQAETAQINTLLRQLDFHQATVGTAIQARPRQAARRWEELPAVGFTGTTKIRVQGQRHPIAAEAIAG